MKDADEEKFVKPTHDSKRIKVLKFHFTKCFRSSFSAQQTKICAETFLAFCIQHSFQL